MRHKHANNAREYRAVSARLISSVLLMVPVGLQAEDATITSNSRITVTFPSFEERKNCLTNFTSIVVLPNDTTSNPTPVIATILGQWITAADIGLPCDTNYVPILVTNSPSIRLTNNPLDRLRSKLETAAVQDYIATNGLKATDEEITEFVEFQNRFAERERLRRHEKLKVLELQLLDPAMSSNQIAQLKAQCDTLRRLEATAKFMDQIDPTAKNEMQRKVSVKWIERAKSGQSLYEKYGGDVHGGTFGLTPVGPIISLLEEYERAGKFVIHDDKLRTNFWVHLRKPQRNILKPEVVDFTPYWKKPLPGTNN